MEITIALVMRQIVVAVIIALGVAVAYSVLALAIGAWLQIIGKNYPEVK